MSLKNSYVTSDYMEWDSMLSLVHKLYRDMSYPDIGRHIYKLINVLLL